MKHLPLPMLAAALSIAGQTPPPARAQAAEWTIEKLIDIKHPSNPVWSPDGRHIAFIWDRAGVSNLYLADAGGQGAQPVALTRFPEGQLTALFWSHD